MARGVRAGRRKEIEKSGLRFIELICWPGYMASDDSANCYGVTEEEVKEGELCGEG